MSKKLVKTAKQQFEERLKELTLLTSYQGVKDENFYLCENGHKEMSILRDSKEHGFFEYKYQGSYQSMVDSEEFLYNMVCRFNEIGEPVKHIFDWYASADKDLTPFTVYDIWQCMEYLTQLAFEDIYEKVPDVRIITAKEQWEKDKKGLRAVRYNDGKVLLVDITVSAVKFYDNYDGYACYSYPSLDEMRKDSFFVSRVVDELMRSANHNKIGDFMEWVREGDDFPLNPAVIYESEYQGFTFMKYEDKEESTGKADNRTVMNMYAPFNWLREDGSGEWEWISEFCNDVNEYGRLDVLFRIIEGTIKAEDEFSNPPTMEEIKADYEQSFPLMLAGVFENLAKDIRKGELKFKMDYRKM